MRLRELPAPVLAASVQLAAAWVALGPPDPGLAGAFLAGDLSMAGAIAASEVLVWLAVVAVAAWTVGAVLLELRRSAEVATPLAQSWELAVLAAGLIILLGGGVHHYSGAAIDLAGGSVEQARSLAGG